jgi:LacI family transcriptional regulator
MRKRATIKDVAALAGVSLKTVSRVINGEPGVSEPLVLRVREAAAQLGYRHNLAASNLRRGHRTQSIGVLLHDLGNAFSATLLRAIEDRARSAGVAVLSASLDDDVERESLLVTDLISRRVDGLIMMPASPDQTYLAAEVRAGLAVVAVDRPVRGADIDTVVVDNRSGATLATRHLLARGHQRVACLTDQSVLWTADERRHGYADALAAASIEYDDSLVVTDLRTEEAAEQAVLALLDQAAPPTAVFAARNNLAVGTVRALRGLGLEHQIALVGFDDFPMADLLEPSVTVIAQDVAAVGAQAAELLFARMGGTDDPPRRVDLPTVLIERGSGELLPRISAA